MRTLKMVLAALAVFAVLTTPAFAQTYRARLAHIAADNHPWHMGAVKFAELVNEKTDGRMEIAVFPGGALGGDRDVAEAISVGTLQMGLVSGVLGNFYPPIDVLEIGFLIESKDHLREVIYGEIGTDIAEGMRDATGIRVLDWWERMPRLLTTNREVNRIEDLARLNIRVPEITAYLRTWEALGANPTPIAFPELYDALRLGVVDAQENPADLIYTTSFYEVVTNLVITNHLHNYILLLVNDDYFDGLPADIQAAIEEAAAEATAYQNQIVTDLEADFMGRLADLMAVIELDPAERQRMIDATATVIDAFDNVPGARELYDRVKAAGEALD